MKNKFTNSMKKGEAIVNELELTELAQLEKELLEMDKESSNPDEADADETLEQELAQLEAEFAEFGASEASTEEEVKTGDRKGLFKELEQLLKAAKGVVVKLRNMTTPEESQRRQMLKDQIAETKKQLEVLQKKLNSLEQELANL